VRRLLICCTILTLGTSCFGPDPNQTTEGESRPVLDAEFPETVEPGAVETFTLTVENPGPGDFSTLFVSFSLVGAAEGVSLPEPIVNVPAKGSPSSVLDVRPKPVKAAEGIRFRFSALPEGETEQIEFDLRVPEKPGVAANSVQVYDGAEPERVRGVLLSTRVQ